MKKWGRLGIILTLIISLSCGVLALGQEDFKGLKWGLDMETATQYLKQVHTYGYSEGIRFLWKETVGDKHLSFRCTFINNLFAAGTVDLGRMPQGVIDALNQKYKKSALTGNIAIPNTVNNAAQIEYFDTSVKVWETIKVLIIVKGSKIFYISKKYYIEALRLNAEIKRRKKKLADEKKKKFYKSF